MFSSKKDDSGQSSTLTSTGIFKGLIEVENDEDKQKYLVVKKKMIDQLKDLIKQISLKFAKKEYLLCPASLTDHEERQKFELLSRKLNIEDLKIPQALANINSEDILKNQLMREQKCTIRFYAISGYDMSSRDAGSNSDTYLALECNGKKYDERKNYQLDEPNPDFYKSYDFEGRFPGSSPLTI